MDCHLYAFLSVDVDRMYSYTCQALLCVAMYCCVLLFVDVCYSALFSVAVWVYIHCYVLLCDGFFAALCFCMLFVVLHHRNIYSHSRAGHRLVTVCTHGDFIVLPHWDPLNHIILIMRGGRIGRALPLRSGDRGFEPWSSQTNDL